MSVIDEKLKRFETIIFSEIEEKTNQIIAEADHYKENALQQHRDAVLNDYYEYMQRQVKEIKADAKRQISLQELASQRDLLLYRNQIAESVFEAVRQKLSRFVQSADYRAFLSQHIQKAIEANNLSAVRIRVRKEDLPLIQAEQFGKDAAVTETADIQLGGFLLTDPEHIFFIDESFDSKLRELVPYFNQISGLSVR